jgi:hypothetical protein
MKFFKWKLPDPYDSSVEPEHPEAEQEIAQSDRIIKSATPKYTLDWYVKWVASAIIILAISFRATGIPELHIYDMWGSLTGCCMWFWVSFIWRDRALMMVNGVAGLILFSGILQYYFT